MTLPPLARVKGYGPGPYIAVRVPKIDFSVKISKNRNFPEFIHFEVPATRDKCHTVKASAEQSTEHSATHHRDSTFVLK